MPNENAGDAPPSNPEPQTSSQGVPPPVPPHQNTLGAIPNSGPQDQEHNTVRDLEQDIRDGEWWLIRIGAAGVIMNVIIAWIYWGQLSQMTKATKASQQSAYAACLAAQIARSSLVETQSSEADTHASTAAIVSEAKAATAGQRAVMQLAAWSKNPQVVEGKPFVVPLLFKNGGNTAALNVQSEFVVVFLRRQDDPDFTYPKGRKLIAFNRVQEPGFGAPGHYAAVIGVDEKEVIASMSDEVAYASGAKDLILYGKMTYRDMFGGHHWRHYCQPFATFPEGVLITETGHEKCAKYNGSDMGTVESDPKQTRSPQALPEISCKKPED